MGVQGERSSLLASLCGLYPQRVTFLDPARGPPSAFTFTIRLTILKLSRYKKMTSSFFGKTHCYMNQLYSIKITPESTRFDKIVDVYWSSSEHLVGY